MFARPAEKESNRWVVVTVICAVAAPLIEQIGMGVREHLKDSRKEKEEKADKSNGTE